MTTIFNFDVESYSTIDLKAAGSFRYAEDSTTDVLCAHWTGGCWMPGDPPPVFPEDSIFEGYNVLKFDAVLWDKILAPRYGWWFPGYDRFRDTMHRAHYTNLPGTLAQVANVLRTTPKDAVGHTLMLKMCKPAKPILASSDPKRLHTPENLALLSAYCAQDVAAETEVSSRLPLLPVREQRVAIVDFRVNERGVQLDRKLVAACIACAGGIAQYYRERMATATKGAVVKETDLPGIGAFCRDHGLAIQVGKGALDKAAIEKYLALPDLDSAVRITLETRSVLGKSSLAKFARMEQAVCGDGRLRGLHEYYGAHQTGRWAGRIVQAQNLPRRGLPNYDAAIQAAHDGPENFLWYYGDDALGVLTGLIRPCLIAAPGNELVVGDYNAIEARVVAWLAGDELLLKAFRTGICPYREMASVVYGVPYDKVTSKQRTLGKVIILACGYGMGAKKFRDTAAKAPYYVTLTDEEAQKYVTLYRTRFYRIKQLWYAADDAAKNAIRNPGVVYEAGKLLFKFDGVDLKIRMPNGCVLWYRRATLGLKNVPWQDEPLPAIFFWGEDEHGNWAPQDTYGGKLVENCCQALSRGITADALVRCEDRGMRPVLTVHDEIACDVRRDTLAPRELESVMCESEPWSSGIPVKVEAFSSPYYRK